MVLTVILAGPASALRVQTPMAGARPAGQIRVCPQSDTPAVMECMSVFSVGTAAGSRARQSAQVSAAAVHGYGPSSLRNAYNLTAAARRAGRGETVAIVDAYSDPKAAANLASYRSHFGLPACTVASRCLRIVNQAGKSRPLPKKSASWGIEESLDLDMVSAICPRCRILLVEASSNSSANLGTAVNRAVSMGARFVSDSWGGDEFAGQDAYTHDFNHPGDAIVFASGDFGYGATFPADTQYVTAVGGTTLRHKRSNGRAWTETVWGSAQVAEGTASGCSSMEPKPSWQRESVDDTAPGGCLNRTENDVAADANINTGVAVYDSFGTGGTWGMAGGTSVAAPIVTAAYALAGNPARNSYPASYLYHHSSHLHDVTAGTNGTCDQHYLCHGQKGYDGPTGLGTPDGTTAFAAKGTDPVTLVDPGPQDVVAGTTYRLSIRGLDTRAAAKTLAYTAAGLPAGLTISSVATTTNGVIAGIVPATPGSYQVTVTGRDRFTGKTGTTRFTLTVTASSASPSPSPAAAQR